MSTRALERPVLNVSDEAADLMPAEQILEGRCNATEDALGLRVGAGHVPPAGAGQMGLTFAHEVPAISRRMWRVGRAARTIPRRAFYRAWGRLPGWVQGLAVRIAAHKVTLGACALIEDRRGRLLVAHHTYRRRAWGLPGGFTKRGEEPAEGLVRELREELGVAALVGPLVYAETESAGRHLTLYYRATLLSAPHADGVELDDLRFVAPDVLPALFGGDGATVLPWLAALRTRRAS